MENDSGKNLSKLTRTIAKALEDWHLLYGREPEPGTAALWERLFRSADPELLAQAVQRATLMTERMPTPGHITKALAQIRAERQELRQSKGTLTHVEGTDSKGVPCWFWSDEPNLPAYAAKDCAEGRALLGKLREVGDRRQLSS